MRLPPQTEYATYHQRLRYRLDCGREVSVEGYYVSPTTLEVLEGSIEWIRDNVIERLPKRAQEHFRWGETCGVFVKPVPEGELPVHAFMVHLLCYEPVSGPKSYTSSLIVCWLSDDIETSLPEMIDREICSVEWDKYAADETPYPPPTEAGGDYKTVESIDQPDKNPVHPLDSWFYLKPRIQQAGDNIMSTLLFIFAVFAFFAGWHLIATVLLIAGAFLTVYEKAEKRKEVEAQARAEQEEQLREEREEQNKFDAFCRERGFPHIFDKVRVAEFARQRSISLDDADSILCAADARFDDYQDGMKALEAGERITNFSKAMKEHHNRPSLSSRK
jgi:hypothetical protein